MMVAKIGGWGLHGANRSVCKDVTVAGPELMFMVYRKCGSISWYTCN